MLCLLDRLVDTPAFVVDDIGTTVLQNRMSKLASGDNTALTGRDRYHVWRWFTDPAIRARFPEEDWPTHSRAHAGDLRATVGRRGDDADVAALVVDLLAASPAFAALWGEHEVAMRRSVAKRTIHPEVGLLDLLCEHLTRDVDGAILVVLHPRPGTDCREKIATSDARYVAPIVRRSRERQPPLTRGKQRHDVDLRRPGSERTIGH